jgi:hypothetical protein
MTGSTARVQEIMEAFSERTGVTPGLPPRRYLWTDAFAVCNYLALHRRTGNGLWLDRARELIDQVHRILGRHRPDDPRDGWISGLPEAEGETHPTIGGLRIGKPLPERGPRDPFDDELEWERDGQYYHYLTRWMHALTRASEDLGDPDLLRYALELGRSAHAAFAHGADGKALYWKMSIDLSRPLVSDMGHHDPLEGLAVSAGIDTLARTMGRADGTREGLELELRDLADMCHARRWATSDALGIGGLLTAAWQLAGLGARAPAAARGLLGPVLDDGARSLDLVATGRYLAGHARQRLAFRELGLSLGLAAVERLRDLQRSGGLADGAGVAAALDRLARHLPLRTRIEGLWLDPSNQTSPTWAEHEDINAVMLATSLASEGYLGPPA